MTQITGDLDFAMDTNIYSTFVQDDWQIAPTVKVLYGVRYDLYKYPGRASRPRRSRRHATSTSTRTTSDRASAWPGRSTPKTVVRASIGIMYDQPILGGYEQALQLSGSPKAPAYTFNGTAAGAPAFPNTGRHGHARGAVAVGGDPELRRSRARGRPTSRSSTRSGRDFTASVGFIYAERRQPAGRDRRQPRSTPIGQLADGRPIFSAVSARRVGSAVQPHLRSAVDRRFDVQGPHAADVEAALPKGSPSTSNTSPAKGSTTRRC